MPIILCPHCDEEFSSTWNCEEHERHCVYNPATKEHAAAERLKSQGMSYQDTMSAYEKDQILLKKWVDNVKPTEEEVK